MTELAQLPAYSGQIVLCQKCDASTITTTYHGNDFVRASCRPDEHLCRVCQNCGFKWQEACARRSRK
jgi:hypothetical protein